MSVLTQFHTQSVPNYKTIYKKLFVLKYKTRYKLLVPFATGVGFYSIWTKIVQSVMKRRLIMLFGCGLMC